MYNVNQTILTSNFHVTLHVLKMKKQSVSVIVSRESISKKHWTFADLKEMLLIQILIRTSNKQSEQILFKVYSVFSDFERAATHLRRSSCGSHLHAQRVSLVLQQSRFASQLQVDVRCVRSEAEVLAEGDAITQNKGQMTQLHVKDKSPIKRRVFLNWIKLNTTQL